MRLEAYEMQLEASKQQQVMQVSTYLLRGYIDIFLVGYSNDSNFGLKIFYYSI